MSLTLSFLFFLSPAIAQSEVDDFKQHNSPKEDFRKEVFQKSLDKRQCKLIARSSLEDVKKLDAQLYDFLNQVLAVAQAQDPKALRKLFHPRLKVTTRTAKKVFAEMVSGTGGTFSLVPYRLWAINTVDGTPEPVECTEDGLSLGGHYGYPLQLGWWLQLTGSIEIARIYLTLVPTPEGWFIGAWHRQQWTQNGKDAETWTREGLEEAAQGRKLGAYAYFDLAQKLLDGGNFVYTQLRLDLNATKEAQLPADKTWKEVIDEIVAPTPLVYVGTILAEDGPGILIRLESSKEELGKDMKARCVDIGKKIYRQSWTQNLGGMQCSYIPKGADPRLFSKLGSFFIPKEDLVDPKADDKAKSK